MVLLIVMQIMEMDCVIMMIYKRYASKSVICRDDNKAYVFNINFAVLIIRTVPQGFFLFPQNKLQVLC